MIQIPLSPVPSQTLSIVLAGQQCQISVYQKSTGVYFDLNSNGTQICYATRCIDSARLVENRGYLGFVGDFFFLDTIENDDPTYTGLGAQFQLLYLEASDLASL